jgi:hypothetical protein
MKISKTQDFSIVVGGPLYQLYLKTRLVKPALSLVKRRIMVITMFTWFPLLILAAFSGVATSGVRVPFVFDLDTHARFLGCLALLIFAEVIAHQRISEIMMQFLKRDIITKEIQPQFERYISSAIKLRNSIIVELVLLALVMSLGHLIWQEYNLTDRSTWYTTVINGKASLNIAGYWYVFISIPVFQFILLRWYFRIFIWYRLLWQISKLPINLNSLHPDRAGGLGFLTDTISAFAAVLIAHTVLLTGMITNRIWHDGATLLDFKVEVISVTALLMAIVLVPLIFFIFAMARDKRVGTHKYGVMASHFVNVFYHKWVDTESTDDSVLGADDIQSLADLSNSFTVTRDMNIIPFSFRNVIQLFLLVVLPLLPLIFTLIPIIDIVRAIVKIFI